MQWRKINAYQGQYEISSTGLVCSLKYGKRRILTPGRSRGYLRVTLSKNNTQKRYLVHRLVALYFIPRVPGKRIINHIDGNPSNNNIENLEWCTFSENEKHAHAVLGKTPPCARRVKNIITGETFNSISKAAHSIKLKPSTLLAKMRGENYNDTPIVYDTA